MRQQLTIVEAAERLRWSYSTTLRHFEKVDGVIIKPGLKSRGRTKRKIIIPEQVFLGEFQKMTTRISVADAADEKLRKIRQQGRIKPAARCAVSNP